MRPARLVLLVQLGALLACGPGTPATIAPPREATVPEPYEVTGASDAGTIPPASTAHDEDAGAPAAPRLIQVSPAPGTHGGPPPVIRFPFGSAKIPSDAEGELRHVVEALKAHPEILTIEVGGNTDLNEATTVRRDLGRERSEAVRDWLVKMGVEAERLQVVSHREMQPLGPNQTAEGRAANRSVRFRVVRQKEP